MATEAISMSSELLPLSSTYGQVPTSLAIHAAASADTSESQRATLPTGPLHLSEQPPMPSKMQMVAALPSTVPTPSVAAPAPQAALGTMASTGAALQEQILHSLPSAWSCSSPPGARDVASGVRTPSRNASPPRRQSTPGRGAGLSAMQVSRSGSCSSMGPPPWTQSQSPIDDSYVMAGKQSQSLLESFVPSPTPGGPHPQSPMPSFVSPPWAQPQSPIGSFVPTSTSRGPPPSAQPQSPVPSFVPSMGQPLSPGMQAPQLSQHPLGGATSLPSPTKSSSQLAFAHLPGGAPTGPGRTPRGTQATSAADAVYVRGNTMTDILFEAVDKNQDGVISRAEFRTAMLNHVVLPTNTGPTSSRSSYGCESNVPSSVGTTDQSTCAQIWR